MKGIIIGDIIGSGYINHPEPTLDIQLFNSQSSFTDNTILTISTADALLRKKNIETSMKEWVKKFPIAGYLPHFFEWALSNKAYLELEEEKIAITRISPIGFASSTLEEAQNKAEITSRIINHTPQCINTSRVCAGSIFLAKQGESKKTIKTYVEDTLKLKLAKNRADYKENINCHTICSDKFIKLIFAAFLESNDYEDAIRKVIYFGGPTNTLASVTGGIAQAYYKHIPKSLIRKAYSRLSPDIFNIITEFEKNYFPS